VTDELQQELAHASERIVAALNFAFNSDPSAMYALVSNRVPCNGLLAADPNIVVDDSPVLYVKGGPFFTVGALGLLNGCLAVAGLPKVAARFSDKRDADGRAKLIGFTLYDDVPLEERSTVDVSGAENRPAIDGPPVDVVPENEGENGG
jgi:hypothetical protein